VCNNKKWTELSWTEFIKVCQKRSTAGQGIADPTEAGTIDKITSRELALHCRRKTQGNSQHHCNDFDLMLALTGHQGHYITGVPLLNKTHKWEIWDNQKHHIPYIQNPGVV